MGPNLHGAAFERAFPFYVLLDASGVVQGCGAALKKALPSMGRGSLLSKHLSPSRPISLLSTTDWSGHDGHALILNAVTPGGLNLRGQIFKHDDGLALLLLSPVLKTFEELRAQGIALTDLAAHDATGDLLLLRRSAQTSLDDAQRLMGRLRLRNQQLKLMSELSTVGVAYFSDAGELQQSTPLFRRLVGWEAALPSPCNVEQVEARLRERAAEHDASSFALETLVDKSSERSDAFVMKTRDGSYLSLVYRQGEGGDHVLFIWDVTRETLLDRMKSEFMSTAAHELRTPMASIFGFSELLVSRELPVDKMRAMAATIHKQSAWMIGLLNDVLDLARIEARQGDDVLLGAVEPAELLPEAISAYCDIDQRARLAWSVPAGVPPIAADRIKARQALGNVINNAVKYSPDGGAVHVRSRVELRGNRTGWCVEVEDHGLGMTDEQLAHVFERFYRADPSCSIPGSGLGMALVQQIMKLHNGTISITSELGRGTCVTLWFPLV
jgi:signal transduction histidine kinase